MDKYFKKRLNESLENYELRISSLIDNDDYDLSWTKIALIINSETGNDYSADRYRKNYKKYTKSLKRAGVESSNEFLNRPSTQEYTYVRNSADYEEYAKSLKRAGIGTSNEPPKSTTTVSSGELDKPEVFEINSDTTDYTYVYTPFNKENVSINFEKNEQTSTRDLSLSEEELKNPDSLLRAHGYSPEEWTIKTATHTKTTRLTADGNNYVYTSRITVKPKEASELTIAEIDKYFTKFNANFSSKCFTSFKIKPTQYDPNGEFLEIDIADLHVGLLSYEQETGEDYDVKIARERLERAMSDIYARCKGRKFKRIILALLGDIMHVDNQNCTTTAGTRQDVDTRVTKMFDEALDMMAKVIASLGKIAPVEVIGITGNHSETLDYCLYKALECAFNNDPNVTFFNSPNPRKWRRYGKVLIGWAHGDIKTKNATEWLQGEAYLDWGKSRFREVHMGHLHSLQTVQKIEDTVSGLITRYQPTLVASSAWEHKEGYCKVPKTMMSYLWNEETGLREVWYSNI